MVQGKINRGKTPTIRLGATPSGLTSAHLHHPPIFLQARCPSRHPANSVKALKANCDNDIKQNFFIMVVSEHVLCVYVHNIG